MHLILVLPDIRLLMVVYQVPVSCYLLVTCCVVRRGPAGPLAERLLVVVLAVSRLGIWLVI